MTTTHVEAWNEMCARVRTTLSSPAMQALLGYIPELRYPDRVYNGNPVAEKIWCRVALVQAGQRRRTLGRPSRVTHQGQVIVQVFTPMADPRASEFSPLATQIIVAGFASGTPNVDFYNAYMRDMPVDTPWLYKRADATYNYEILE